MKNLPDDLHAELRRRAADRGVTIRDYVLDLIRRDHERPSMEEWLRGVRRLPRVELDRPMHELIAADREERNRELARRTGTPG